MAKRKQAKKKRSSYPKITEYLRTEIVAGRLAPGSLLPPRLQLLKEFDAAPVTIQEAIHQLREEGFLE
jgi:DNA-binding GntR family transcriptional regulator